MPPSPFFLSPGLLVDLMRKSKFTQEELVAKMVGNPAAEKAEEMIRDIPVDAIETTSSHWCPKLRVSRLQDPNFPQGTPRPSSPKSPHPFLYPFCMSALAALTVFL